MSAGLFQASQTWLSFAFTTVSTVIFMGVLLNGLEVHPIIEWEMGKSTSVRSNWFASLLARHPVPSNSG